MNKDIGFEHNYRYNDAWLECSWDSKRDTITVVVKESGQNVTLIDNQPWGTTSDDMSDNPKISEDGRWLLDMFYRDFRDSVHTTKLHDYYEKSSLWIGRDYRSTSNPLNGALVIGHSTYGTKKTDPPGIIAWIKGEEHDQTFTVFFNQTTTTGLRAAEAGTDERADFFHSMAFYNFVPHSLGEKDRSPTAAEYLQAAKDLPAIIERAQPRGIFVFGVAHHWYSLRVIRPTKIPYVDSVHPVQDSRHRFLPAWRRFEEMLK